MEDAPDYLTRNHEIVEVERSELVAELVDGIARLLQEHAEHDAPDLRRSHWLLATLRQLPIPMPWYEESARSLGRSTIRRMISHLGARSGRVPDDLGPVVQTLRMSFDQLYAEIERDNPRAPALVKAIANATQKEPADRVLVLVRDSVMERAAKNWLQLEALAEADWLQRVAVCGCPSFDGLREPGFAVAIVNGALPRRYRWIGGAALAPRVVFLCYPEDSDIVEKQLRSFYEPDRGVAAAERERFLAPLVPTVHRRRTEGPSRETPELVISRAPTRPAAGRVAKKERLRTVEGGLQALKIAVEAARRAEEEAHRLALRQPVEWKEESVEEDSLLRDLQDVTASVEPDDVECLRLHVNSRSQGLGHLFVLSSEPVEAVRPSEPGDVLRTLPRDLEPGDVLLRMADGRRAGLFDRIVELTEGQPQLKNLAVYRSRWRSAIGQLAQRYTSSGAVSYARMLAALRAAGAPIETELALRWWVRELVIGPEKISSITAVGRVIGDDAMVHGAREFDQAFRRIRGIRQGIGRRLNSAIRRSFQHVEVAGPAGPRDNLDDALGVPLDELVESIDMAEILAIDEPRLVPAHLVDRILKDE